MKDIFSKGDIKTYITTVKEGDVAAFHGETVHEVCSTFALARDIEYSSRLFVLEICGDDEEGIGTFVNVIHKSPAFVGEKLTIKARITGIIQNELICSITVKAGKRLVATGETGQKILLKSKIKNYFAQIRNHEQKR